MEFGGTSWITTLFAPIFEPWPTVIGPSSFAPEPIVTLSCTVGWRLPVAKPVPPSVTPWYSVTSSPISAVSPITTPMPWSMKKPRPIFAAGWISIPVIVRDSVRDHPRQQRHAGVVERVRDAVGEQRVDARPGGEDLERADVPRAAGSRLRAASMSRRTSPTMRSNRPKPNMRKA